MGLFTLFLLAGFTIRFTIEYKISIHYNGGLQAQYITTLERHLS